MRTKTGTFSRTFLLAGLAMLAGLSSVMAYSFEDLKWDIAMDTKKAFGKGLKAAYFYDAFERDALDRNKIGASAPIVAYKIVTAEVAFIYTPRSANEIGSVGFSFPIRFNDMPIGMGKTLGDLVGESNPDSKSWIDRLFIGPFFSHNLRTGKFGAGVTSGVTF